MKRSCASEMMDAADIAADLLIDDLRNLRHLNRYLGNYRSVSWGLARLVGEQKQFSLLDVGMGSGDVLRAIVEWGNRAGLRARLSGLDLNPIAVAQAAAHIRSIDEISLFQGDAGALPFRPGTFDFVLASQVLHHFSEERIVALLRHWSAVARRGIIVSDLIRHPLPYYGVALLTRLFTRNVMTRTDAPLSVQRGFTMAEWSRLLNAAGVGNCEMYWMFPFRLLALIKLSKTR